jgi:hypothetical protein
VTEQLGEVASPGLPPHRSGWGTVVVAVAFGAMSRTPRIVSVNVGEPRTVEWRGREVTTGIWKSPVSGPVRVEGVNVAGDDQADRRVHGGVDKAVYAYALEDYEWWAAALADGDGPVELTPGTFGENLTTEGIDLTGARIGDRWSVGDVVLEVSQPRQPCYKLGIRRGTTASPTSSPPPPAPAPTSASCRPAPSNPATRSTSPPPPNPTSPSALLSTTRSRPTSSPSSPRTIASPPAGAGTPHASWPTPKRDLEAMSPGGGDSLPRKGGKPAVSR